MSYEPLPPINMSDLEQNILQPYGEGEIVFNQNTVPFDFDGKRLLWLKYCNKDVRELYIYVFEEAKPKLIHTLGVNDGMVSHVKFLKKRDSVGTKIFYVKDTQEIICFDIASKESKTIGKAPDSIIAFNVNDGSIRESHNKNVDPETGASSADSYSVICLDES